MQHYLQTDDFGNEVNVLIASHIDTWEGSTATYGFEAAFIPRADSQDI